MLHQGISIMLAPVLVFQGLKVRRTTPRLPEPEGERVGQTGSNPALSLLIIVQLLAHLFRCSELPNRRFFDCKYLQSYTDNSVFLSPL